MKSATIYAGEETNAKEMRPILAKKKEENTKNEFLDLIRKYQDKVVGYETYGDTTDFYDEDGCVLFTTTPDQEKPNYLVFNFPEIEESFVFEME